MTTSVHAWPTPKRWGRKDDMDFPAKNVLWLPRSQSGSSSRQVLRQSDVPSAHMDAAHIPHNSKHCMYNHYYVLNTKSCMSSAGTCVYTVVHWPTTLQPSPDAADTSTYQWAQHHLLPIPTLHSTMHTRQKFKRLYWRSYPPKIEKTESGIHILVLCLNFSHLNS